MSGLITVFGLQKNSHNDLHGIWSLLNAVDGQVLCCASAEITGSGTPCNQGVEAVIEELTASLLDKSGLVIGVRRHENRTLVLSLWSQQQELLHAPTVAKLVSLDGSSKTVDLRKSDEIQIPPGSHLLVPSSKEWEKRLDNFLIAVNTLPVDARTSVLYGLCAPYLETRIESLDSRLQILRESLRHGRNQVSHQDESESNWVTPFKVNLFHALISLLAVVSLGIYLGSRLANVEGQLAQFQPKSKSAESVASASAKTGTERDLARELRDAIIASPRDALKDLNRTYRLERIDDPLHSKDFARAALKLEAQKAGNALGHELLDAAQASITASLIVSGRVMPNEATQLLVCRAYADAHHRPFGPAGLYQLREDQCRSLQIERVRSGFDELMRWVAQSR